MMFDLEKFMDTGVIESYCLGNLSDKEAKELTRLAFENPELQAEIDKTLETLEIYGTRYKPNANLKNRVLSFLDEVIQVEKKINLNNPPIIHQRSDANAWSVAIADLEPQTNCEDFACHSLKDDPENTLMVVWLYTELVEDEHDESDFLESFLILEGACECNFDGQIVQFSAGDYFEVPPNVKHTIKNISGNISCVKGLVQRRLVA